MLKNTTSSFSPLPKYKNQPIKSWKTLQQHFQENVFVFFNNTLFSKFRSWQRRTCNVTWSYTLSHLSDSHKSRGQVGWSCWNLPAYCWGRHVIGSVCCGWQTPRHVILLASKPVIHSASSVPSTSLYTTARITGVKVYFSGICLWW